VNKTDRAARRPLFRAFLAVSLDGYIADEHGGVAWLNPYITPEIDFQGFWSTIGATVMGRATYDWTVAHRYAIEAPGRCIVQTHRPLKEARPGVEAFAGDVRKLAAELRRELAGSGKDVCLFGGGESIASFHAHGLVDRWELAIIPVLLGDGIPLFPSRSHRVERLKLARSRALKNGVLEVWYEPDQSPARARDRRSRLGCG
jgi:dihydrofolate reductase